jgi:Tol biopolymer transport system component/predicted Ser/Thr protein kinase
MDLNAGAKLGPYEIVTPIGAGGMGQVYRARDPRVGRDVAIKVSSEQFSDRFKREARLVGLLNHPNICTLHDVGPDFLVMELVEGPTLADRIRSGPIPAEEALSIARQIADALEAAHEKGVVHRDLKPGNIKIRPDGTVKVLDFGLAKAPESAAPEASPEDSPTVADPGPTRPGEIFGTAAYMSPEQARGKSVDKRADIWAFGVILYEMLSGRRLFQGETISDTLAAVLRAEPEWHRIPARIQPLLRRCLERDPKRRLHDIADARLWLEEAPAAAAVPGESRRTGRLGWIAAGVVTLAAVLGFVLLRREPLPAEAVRFEVWPAEKATLSDVITVSPDGRKLAFIATTDRSRLWIRSLETLDAQPLAGTEDVTGAVFWSPDSRFIVYRVAGRMRKIEASGGPSQPISDDIPNSITGGFWSAGDQIVFSYTTGPGVLQVAASGGSLTLITNGGFGPSPLPDGQHFLYTRTGSGIFLGSLDAKPEEQSSMPLLPDSSKSIYVPDPNARSGDGHLLFLRAGTLMAQPFDARRRSLAGEPVPVAERVASSAAISPGGLVLSAAFTASPAGVLVYRSNPTGDPVATLSQASQFTWFSREGKVLGTVGEPGSYFQMSLSADAKRLAAVQLTPPGPDTFDVWLIELVGGMRSSRFTLHQASDTWPLWSPDGSRIVFASARSGVFNLYHKASSGAGSEDLLHKSSEVQRPTSWSSDGRFILIWSTGNATKTAGDIWVLPMDSQSTSSENQESRAMPLIRTEFNELEGRFSPDGRWVSYTSNESGSQFEVYVRPFDPSMAAGSPRSESKWLVSKGGGRNAHWRGDSKELFYIAPDNTIMAVEVGVAGAADNPVFQAGVPRPLFKAQPVSLFWEVTPDGQRFLIPVAVADNSASPYRVVLNWLSTLNR